MQGEGAGNFRGEVYKGGGTLKAFLERYTGAETTTGERYFTRSRDDEKCPTHVSVNAQ
jgi:hypothetical protein